MRNGRNEGHEYVGSHRLKMEGDAVEKKRYQHVRGNRPRHSAVVHEKGADGNLNQHRSQGGETLQLGRRVFVSGMRYEHFGEDVLKAFTQIRP